MGLMDFIFIVLVFILFGEQPGIWFTIGILWSFIYGGICYYMDIGEEDESTNRN